jgi:hypothetical protein
MAEIPPSKVSELTNQYPSPSPVVASPLHDQGWEPSGERQTSGPWVIGLPKKGAPNEKMPPSAATSQYPGDVPTEAAADFSVATKNMATIRKIAGSVFNADPHIGCRRLILLFFVAQLDW